MKAYLVVLSIITFCSHSFASIEKINCPEKDLCHHQHCTVGERIIDVQKNDFAGETIIQPKEVELALSPQANLAYSYGEFQMKYDQGNFTTGQKSKKTISGKAESSSMLQLRSVDLKDEKISQIFIEDKKLYIVSEGTRSSPFLAAWNINCKSK